MLSRNYFRETEGLVIERKKYAGYKTITVYHLGEWALEIEREQLPSGSYKAELRLLNKRILRRVCYVEFGYSRVIRQRESNKEMALLFFDETDCEIINISIDKDNRYFVIEIYEEEGW